MRMFFLFAPAFNQSGVAVATNLAAFYDRLEVDGLVTGSDPVFHDVEANLGTLTGELHQLDQLERSWVKTTPPPDVWKSVKTTFDSASFNRVLVADRHVGAGFVVGGIQARSALKDYMAKNPISAPANYLCHIMNWSLKYLERRQPDALFLYAVAGAPAVALVEAASVLDIPVRVLTPTRVGQRYAVDTDPYGGLARPTSRFHAVRHGKEQISQDNLRAGKTFLQRFKYQPEAPGYMVQAKKQQERQTPGRALARSAIRFIGSITKRDSKTVRVNPIYVSFYDLKLGFRRRLRLRKKDRMARAIPQDRRYVFYPLHVDPEASTMVAAPWHTDQLAIIEGIAKSLPIDCCLLVKEHGPMVGRRPRGFYRRITEMPRVCLVSHEHSSFDLIRKASLVCAITGTAGWEAAILGVPALIFGTPFYTNLPRGVTHCSDISQLPSVVPKAMAQEACSEYELELFIAAIYECSFDLQSGFLWGKDNLNTASWHECARIVAKEITLSLDGDGGHSAET